MTETRELAEPDNVTRTRHAPGTPCWASLVAHRPDMLQEFYHAVLGWEFRTGPERPGPYVRALLDGREVAGIGRLRSDRHLPVAWTPYFASDDVDLTAATVRMCGGTVGVGPLDIGDAGRLAICCDPGGAVFGVRDTATGHGSTLAGIPGTPVWNELVTAKSVTVAAFYETVFGYERRPDAIDLDRIALHVDGRPVAVVHGVGEALPRDRGPHWMTSFEVADTDAVVALVAELGGRVLHTAHDGARGRVAMVADPEGARFSVLQKRR